MREMRNTKTGTVINVREHIILVNFWEYYITDDEPANNDIQFALVCGYEIELGSVSRSELRPYIVSIATGNSLRDLAPAPGWEWV